LQTSWPEIFLLLEQVMKRSALYVCLSILTAGASLAGNLTTTYMGFDPKNSQNDLPQSITYQMPDTSAFGQGPYPVFLWTPGTMENYADPLGLTMVRQMALRGFIAATVQYSNTNAVQNCNAYTSRAKSVYDATRSGSAVGVLCTLPGASCAKGIATAGISEGGMLSVLAKNYAPNVQASFAMSVSDYDQNGSINLSSCMDKPYTAIPANRLTIVNGQADTLFGGQTPLQNVSGYTCPSGTFQCWSPDGSGAGWYIIQNSQVTDGVADHCYEMVGGCTLTTFDGNWYLPSTYNWSLAPNLDWLASLGTRRTFSATGQ
jgi:hypothetical protein